MFLREPLYCRTPRFVVETGKLKKPVRVALTNDWHVTSIVSDKQCEMLEKSLKNILPDLIIIQGDSFDTPKAFDDSDLVRALKKRLKLCAKIAPTIMILGNHDQVEPVHFRPKDYADYLTHVRKNVMAEWRRICNETGVKLIVDSWFEIEGLRIFGFFQGPEMFYQESDGGGENYDEMKRKIKELSKEQILRSTNKKVSWFVAHAPINELYKMRELKEFEIFSFGHTHGGCVPIGIDFIVDALGGHGGIVAPFRKLFPSRFMRGHDKVKKGTSYIVNTGMVMAQGSAPKVLQCANFLKAAEVTEVVVK